MAREQALQRLAVRQHGLASRNQLLALGFSRREIDGRVASARWRIVAPRTFDVAPAGTDPLRPLHAVVLSTGGWASFRSAGMLRKLVDVSPPRPEITVVEGRLPRGVDATVHRTRVLPSSDRDVVDGIACTSLHRTLLDLGSEVSERTLSIAVNRALVSRRTTSTRLLTLVDAAPMHGRRGARLLRTVLLPYRADRADCDSVLEALLATAVAKSVLPAPRRQYRTRVGGLRARLDVAWPDQRVFIEVDGLAEHTERSAFDLDRRRQNLLVAAGWLPLRYTWTDLTVRPAEVIAEIAQVLRSRSTATVAS